MVGEAPFQPLAWCPRPTAGASGPEAVPSAQVLEGIQRLESGASLGGAGRSQFPPPGDATRGLQHQPCPAPLLRSAPQSPSGRRAAAAYLSRLRRELSYPRSWMVLGYGLGACSQESSRLCDFLQGWRPGTGHSERSRHFFSALGPFTSSHLVGGSGLSWNSSPRLHARPDM